MSMDLKKPRMNFKIVVPFCIEMIQLVNDNQIQNFITQGFVKIENAFSGEIAKECRKILWRDTGCRPDDPSTWTRPVIRLWDYKQESFVKAANTSTLHAAFDQLALDQFRPVQGRAVD